MTDSFKGKTLLILGLARQGTALAKFASKAGATVIVSDLRPAEKLEESMTALADFPIEYVLEEHPSSLLDGVAEIAVSGSVPLTAPIIQEAISRDIRLSNDSQAFLTRCPVKQTIGITGSAGKTTTTTLMGEIGRAANRLTWVGGNIGHPLISDLGFMSEDDLVVQELSSFQLDLWQTSPHIAAITNVTPNHLDRHKSMDAYTKAKANILRFQTANDIAVLSADDDGAYNLRDLVQGRLRLFSRKRSVKDGAFLRNGWIMLADGNGGEKAVLPIDQIQLRGAHNVSNVLAAIVLADSVGIDVYAMRQAIVNFKGVEHRLELVRTINGVTYINDSIATAPERALAGLSAFENETILLLAGGKDKDMVWETWAHTVANRVKTVILFGELSDLLAEKLSAVKKTVLVDIVNVNTLTEAVAVVAEYAEDGDCVLLSPGGTSYDAYEDFAERGRHFRQLVGNL